MQIKRAVWIALAVLAFILLIAFLRGCKEHPFHNPFGGTVQQTWYVRPDGGTRYSDFNKNGECDGLGNAPYPGSGTNQHCAWKDIRSLWADGSYTTVSGYPKYGWVGNGGDTYLIDCPTDCRIGYSGPNSNDYFNAIAGNPYSSGAPVPPSGTVEGRTKILGRNWQNCKADSDKAHINGGYGVSGIFNFQGVSYLDVACLDITDHSNCGKAGQTSRCNTGYPLSDYADNGFSTSNTSTHISFTDIRIHGLTNAGIIGPVGDDVIITRMALVGNASSGWNMDRGNGTTGTGTLTMDQFQTLWNGCAEEYPIVDPLPYADCTDQNSSGYGDGIGTATAQSSPPWHVIITHSVAAYNTQDGFDLLHLSGGGSTLTITDSQMYSNMGQQLKVGSHSTAQNNLIVGNCNALRQAIPGTPPGYNSRLSNFCRAGDETTAITVSDDAATDFQFNTMYCANATCTSIYCAAAACTTLSAIHYQNNTFVGFKNDAANGYPGSVTNDYSNPIYTDPKVQGILGNPGSKFDHNSSWHWKSNWQCPRSSWGESAAVCTDPQLKDAEWHLYGIGDMTPLVASPLVGAGTPIDGVTTDHSGSPRPTPPAISALEPNSKPPTPPETLTLTCPTTITKNVPFECTVK